MLALLMYQAQDGSHAFSLIQQRLYAMREVYTMSIIIKWKKELYE